MGFILRGVGSDRLVHLFSSFLSLVPALSFSVAPPSQLLWEGFLFLVCFCFVCLLEGLLCKARCPGPPEWPWPRSVCGADRTRVVCPKATATVHGQDFRSRFIRGGVKTFYDLPQGSDDGLRYSVTSPLPHFWQALG